ncbi:ribonuclease Z [Ureibacillus sinduriensis]|uniref:Ribonuclease Z n=1 Tax=Ureibacillus sinduriensis BLB-1 = JCM 15800 TaxID=1384057 RepID=A0A0A3HQ46_9BACL|nr:ribonuclease Z [Ureibacillus sinduriensis]KGR74701.1 ribonuclease Z [Ureibacillus sinduriensis BLB-1 = JCM 15800]
MQLQFLGTGAGMPSKERNTSALVLKLLEERGTVWLFDCGEATQHQILHTTIRPRKVEKIFITHLHGDHIFGLPGFLSSRSFLGGEDALTLYGPKGLQEWITATLAVSKTHLTYAIKFVEVEEGVIYEDDQFIVRARLLEHVIPCFGYRIEQKPLKGELLIEKARNLGVPKGPLLGKLKNGEDITLEDGRKVFSHEVTASPKKGFTISILGDTKYCEPAKVLSDDADIVVHEATFDHTTEHLAASYGHSTNVEAAKIALESKAKYLVLNHLSSRFLPHDIEVLLNQAKAVFPNSFIAHDLSNYEWKNGELFEEQ